MHFYTFKLKMLDILRKEAIEEVKFGYLKKKYPTKHTYLATIRANKPVVRTVILRDCIDEIDPLFYTDARSFKVEDLKHNENASALFYNPKKLIQIRLEGQLRLLKDDDLIKKHREKALSISKKDYTSCFSPGEEISNPDALEYLKSDFFQGIYLQVEKIEYLKLKRPNHIRCEFNKKDNAWSNRFLAP